MTLINIHEDGATDTNWKGLKIEVMSRAQAESYVPETADEVCISIKSISAYALGSERDAKLSSKFQSILYLSFDDVAVELKETDSDVIAYMNTIAFTPKIAQEVVRFVKMSLSKKKLVIHCFAGISRSRSMAAAICKALNLPYNFTIYNKNVYDILLKEFEDDARIDNNI